jgi:hypothetical protein
MNVYEWWTIPVMKRRTDGEVWPKKQKDQVLKIQTILSVRSSLKTFPNVEGSIYKIIFFCFFLSIQLQYLSQKYLHTYKFCQFIVCTKLFNKS